MWSATWATSSWCILIKLQSRHLFWHLGTSIFILSKNKVHHRNLRPKLPLETKFEQNWRL